MSLLHKIKKPRPRHLYSILFVLLITLPALVGLAGTVASAPKTPKPPALQWRLLLEADYYHAWEHYLDDRLADIDLLTKAKRWVDYRLFKTTDMPEVYVGRDGWLFSDRDIDTYRQKDCDLATRVHQLLFEVDTIAHLVEASGRRFFFSVAPAKSTIYPEFVGDLPKEPHCLRSFYDLLLETQNTRRLPCFVRLDEALRRAKTPEVLLYSKTGDAWNENGAAIAAQTLVNEIIRDATGTGNIHADLSALLLGETQPLEQPTTNQGRYQLSSAVVYGGSAINALLPYLAKPFTRIDAIAADTIPSANHDENLSSYDTVAVIVDEARLPDLRFDLDGLCRMLSADNLADDEKSVPLKTCTPESHLSLNAEESRLAVKSLGAEASFRLPPLPGSDADTLRILAMNITAPATDHLGWGLVHKNDRMGTKLIRGGTTRIYLPLPGQPSLNLRIYPGQSTGLFFVSDATLLEYKNGVSAPLPEASAEASAPERFQAASAPSQQNQPNAVADAKAPPAAQDLTSPAALHLNDFEDLRVFQRIGDMADIMVSGTFNGPAQAVAARITRHSHDETITPWKIIDSRPSNGIFMGIISEVPQGGWYRLEVRFADQPQFMDRGQSRWGVGILAACIGQSNMNEMFYAGNDLNAHSLLALHREGQWRPMAQTGNGAIALGNRLIGKLGIPVGLLDYAVNGSGLRQEADWGTGYWSDRSEQGIFAAFTKGVAVAGGALEYVVWMQGEADAARGTISGNQYRNALSTFIERQVRPDIVNASHLSHLPFLIVGMVKRPVGKDRPHQEIRDALTAITREVPDCYLAATTVDLKNLGRQHLAPEAYTTLGLRVAQTILYLMEEESYYRGPTVIGGQRLNADTIQINLAHQGGNDFTPASGITGWQVLGKGGPIAITEAWRHDAQTINLRLDRAFESPIIINYLHGANPDSDGAIHDNSAMELPLEPAWMEVE